MGCAAMRSSTRVFDALPRPCSGYVAVGRPSSSASSTQMSRTASRLPGGFIFVTQGLLRILSEEDLLSAALGHEVAHIALGHMTEMLREYTNARMPRSEGENSEYPRATGSGVPEPPNSLPPRLEAPKRASVNVVHEREKEADRAAARYLRAVGIDLARRGSAPDPAFGAAGARCLQQRDASHLAGADPQPGGVPEQPGVSEQRSEGARSIAPGVSSGRSRRSLAASGASSLAPVQTMLAAWMECPGYSGDAVHALDIFRHARHVVAVCHQGG